MRSDQDVNVNNQCPRCGAVIKSGEICEYCGARLVNEEPVREEVHDDPNAPVYVTEPDHEAIRKRRIRTVIIAVALFWAILWLIVMFGSMKKRHINVDVSVKVNNQAEETPAGDPKDYMTDDGREAFEEIAEILMKGWQEGEKEK
ncbi:MAG: zinc ribbon domain-containing protein [Lachnospiraceae bacterium]|nr:zinc ribbon domain-containing protein [Lachnospiraceae bacterium]